ncbi:MAG: SRPBCC domain-containing protein, partial [Calditrichaeota bacterium]|nr:SRPBCC domain-containing protein [Calditrichota bacterium]
MTAEDQAKELYITRIYNAKIEQVWDAWVDPEQVAQWWGPRGFILTTKRKDVRTGGDWLYTMHGPDGTDYPNHTKFLEVDEYKRLVYDHGGFEDKPPLFRVTVEFTDVSGKTKMEMKMALATREEADKTRKLIKDVGGNSTWDRLAEFLEKESTGKEVFVINRSFNVDIETMFEVWTDPEHIMNWLAPKGFKGHYIKANIREGGEAFYSMTGDGMVMYGKANYLEIVKPYRLVYTQVFVDKDGKISRHPMAPTWPEVMKTTVTFNEEQFGQTRVTIEWEIYDDATEIERDTFKGAKNGMALGWTGSFDKLEDYL